MVKVFDFLCPECGYEVELYVSDTKTPQTCSECGAEMVRLPAGTRTTFKFADKKSRKD